jgi:hypothetical protein
VTHVDEFGPGAQVARNDHLAYQTHSAASLNHHAIFSLEIFLRVYRFTNQCLLRYFSLQILVILLFDIIFINR